MTDRRRENFERDGYLIMPGFADASACDALQRRMAELIEAFEPDEVAAIFSTTEKTHAQDEYFLTSGDKIRFFFEEQAFNESGNLRQSKKKSINKVGHALHDLDPVFSDFSRAPALAELVKTLGVRAPLLLQSMYIFKQPRIGGEVVCHQDATFLYTEPSSVIGLWFALEDATRGERLSLGRCPAATEGPLRSRFVRRGDGTADDRARPDAAFDRGTGAARGRTRLAHRAARSASPLERTEPIQELTPRVCSARGRRRSHIRL